MKTPHDFFKAITGIAMENGIRYLLFAGFAWLLAYVLFRRRWFHRKIIARLPSSADVRREMGYSVLTVLIYGIGGTLTIWMAKQGWTHLYGRIPKFGWGWFVASIFCIIILHDAYFYWTHRLMHHPRLYRWFHRVHHQSNNPSPWAAYSFGPLEAAIQVGIFPLSVLVMPVHPLAFFIFLVWQIAFNVAGHTGFEFYPRWWLDTWFGRFMNTPTNHVMHHEYYRGNYGLYFNVWDRLMGTNHEKYEERFKEVTGRSRAA
ncbi:sterol desaturase family protein [Verrucomicrobium sp. BvORR034]|uniref:sterol desaturase family protein n=1 Tax=Verrucomicrobium sp. BvORR034 TaxID=1396418 RepID=UPI000679CA08|nr:sterol desaturase family protein [Verrucomicrobium sp. BvORR034]